MAFSRLNEPIEPMTLGNMRANGVRSIAVSCWQCHHEAVLCADCWPDHMTVPTFGPRMVCTPMRHRRCRRAAELARAAGAGEPERRSMAVRPRKRGRGANGAPPKPKPQPGGQLRVGLWRFNMGDPRRRDRTLIPHPFLACSRSKTGRMVADFPVRISAGHLPEVPVSSAPPRSLASRPLSTIGPGWCDAGALLHSRDLGPLAAGRPRDGRAGDHVCRQAADRGDPG
jgi:hypothetical protein